MVRPSDMMPETKYAPMYCRSTVKTHPSISKPNLKKIFFVTAVRGKSIFCGKAGTGKTENIDFSGKRFHKHVPSLLCLKRMTAQPILLRCSA